jgi:hypothetical protein
LYAAAGMRGATREMTVGKRARGCWYAGSQYSPTCNRQKCLYAAAGMRGVKIVRPATDKNDCMLLLVCGEPR